MALPSANTMMRMQYLATERGCQLKVDSAATPAFSMVKAYDGSLALGASATLANTEAFCAAVDPAMVSQT